MLKSLTKKIYIHVNMEINRRNGNVKVQKISAKGLRLNGITIERKNSDSDLPFICAYVLVEFPTETLGRT